MGKYVNGVWVEDDDIEEVEEKEPEGIYISDEFFRQDQFASGNRERTKKQSIYRGKEPNGYDVSQHEDEACFLLANLKALAQNNPQIIKNLLTDNEDGTVTVHLFAMDGKQKKPLPIRVEKTPMDMDYNSAPWVKYTEKAVAASGLANADYLGSIPNEMIDANGDFNGDKIDIKKELDGGDPGLFMNLLVPGNVLSVSEDKQKGMIEAEDEATARTTFEDTLKEAFAKKYPITVNLSDGELNHVAVLGGIEEHNGAQCLRVDDQLSSNGTRYVPLEKAFKGNSEIINISIYPMNEDGTGDIEPQSINTAVLYRRFEEAQRQKAAQQNAPKKEEPKVPEKKEPEKEEPINIPVNEPEIKPEIKPEVAAVNQPRNAQEKQGITNDQIDLFRRAIGEGAKELEKAKTFTNSKEYKDLITMMKAVATGQGKEMMAGSTEAATFANQVYYIQDRLDAYLDHKAMDGVKPNVYRKLLAVEKTSKLLKKCAETLGDQKIEKGIPGVRTPEKNSDIKFSYKDVKADHEASWGPGTAPDPKSKEDILTAAGRITPPGQDNKQNAKDIRAVDNCMCKILLKAKRNGFRTQGDIAALRESFINNPPAKEAPEKTKAENNLTL